MGKNSAIGLDDGGGGEARRRIVLLAIAGGSAAVIAGAALLRRWWIRPSAKSDPEDDSADAILPHLLNKMLDIVIYAADEVDEEEELTAFNGLTSVLPSFFVPSEVLKALFKNLGASDFGTEISSVGIKWKTLFRPIPQVGVQLCSKSDDPIKTAYVYKEGAVIIEELAESDDDETVQLSTKNGLYSDEITSNIKHALLSAETIRSCIEDMVESCLLAYVPVPLLPCLHALLMKELSIISESSGQLVSAPTKFHISITRRNNEKQTQLAKTVMDVNVPEFACEEHSHLASRPNQTLKISIVGTETGTNETILFSGNEKSVAAPEGIGKAANAHTDSAVAAQIQSKKADEEAKSLINKIKREKKKEKKKNKKTNAGLTFSKQEAKNEREDQYEETETVSAKEELSMATEKKKKKNKTNAGLTFSKQEVAQPGVETELNAHMKCLEHETGARKEKLEASVPCAKVLVQAKEEKDSEKVVVTNVSNDPESRSAINKKKREKKKEKKKRNKPIQNQAPKVKGGFKVVEMERTDIANQVEVICEKSYTGVKGMINLGNTCFMNAILQCLTHCEPLIKKLEIIDHASPCSSESFCYICSLKKIIDDTKRGEKTVMCPKLFKDDLPSLLYGFLEGQQADAQEYLHRFLDELNGPAEVFWGISTNLFRCCRCNTSAHSGSVFEFNHLSLNITSTTTTLNEALKSYISASPAEGYNFDGCKCSSIVEKTEVLAMVPEVLVLHLKSYKYDTRVGATQKLSHRVKYPVQMDMAAYMIGSSTPHCLYELSAIVEHRGASGNFGHYVSIIRHDSAWYLCDDAQVTQVAEEEALKTDAYILMYTKMN